MFRSQRDGLPGRRGGVPKLGVRTIRGQLISGQQQLCLWGGDAGRYHCSGLYDRGGISCSSDSRESAQVQHRGRWGPHWYNITIPLYDTHINTWASSDPKPEEATEATEASAGAVDQRESLRGVYTEHVFTDPLGAETTQRYSHYKTFHCRCEPVWYFIILLTLLQSAKIK